MNKRDDLIERMRATVSEIEAIAGEFESTVDFSEIPRLCASYLALAEQHAALVAALWDYVDQNGWANVRGQASIRLRALLAAEPLRVRGGNYDPVGGSMTAAILTRAEVEETLAKLSDPGGVLVTSAEAMALCASHLALAEQHAALVAAVRRAFPILVMVAAQNSEHPELQGIADELSALLVVGVRGEG